ncbi:capsular polysaccharide biosynthesis protein [Microbulbifer sp. ZKSA006]|uniref:capsular polysaccharide biosynthesis protein n=1 Tax=Microbulbifer sp. ZKSA006 TaxID=3243390 RepID=UPI00403A6D80
MSVAGHCSLGLRQFNFLEVFLGSRCQYVMFRPSRQIKFMFGWGLKPTAIKAKKIAAKAGVPFVCIEDGFLRSLGLGVNGAVSHSLVIDRTGIYYDASKSSDLENLIIKSDFVAEELDRAEKGIELLRSNQLCKYNQSLKRPLNWSKKSPKVLVVDQTFGDVSIRAGLASPAHFQDMLESAIKENPEAEIYVKIHPDVIAGKKLGYLHELALKLRCNIVSEDISPWSIFESVDKVYVVTSQLGFDALIAGKEVHCFGLPFYAGWGLTRDRQSLARRNVSRSLAQVFCAAYLRYCQYINPYTGQKCKFEDTVDLIVEQRRQWLRFQGAWLGIGFSLWKKKFIPNFLGGSAGLTFAGSEDAIARYPRETNVFVWASRVTESLCRTVEQGRKRLWKVEDGFLRSAGLGVDLVAPSSLVFDSRGIYFDASSPSDLEYILRETQFSSAILRRAEKLHSILLKKRVTKYNIAGPITLDIPSNKKVILVPGQVESDASIKFGSPVIKSNLSLLQQVRAENPNAYIIYKPHPDVVAGARLGKLPIHAQLTYDSLLQEGDISSVLEQVDEVHTISSLAGFEALLRGVRVVTYGLPFYAGWGLTHDILIANRKLAINDFSDFKRRRARTLTLPQLIAGTLLLYPNYSDCKTGDFIDAETTVELLERRRAEQEKKGVLFSVFCWYRRAFLRY